MIELKIELMEDMPRLSASYLMILVVALARTEWPWQCKEVDGPQLIDQTSLSSSTHGLLTQWRGLHGIFIQSSKLSLFTNMNILIMYILFKLSLKDLEDARVRYIIAPDSGLMIFLPSVFSKATCG